MLPISLRRRRLTLLFEGSLSWAKSRSAAIAAGDTLPLEESVTVVPLNFGVKFRSQGDWRVDNLLIDPYGRG